MALRPERDLKGIAHALGNSGNHGRVVDSTNGRSGGGGVEGERVFGCGVEAVTAPTVAQRDLAVQLARGRGVEREAPGAGE